MVPGHRRVHRLVVLVSGRGSNLEALIEARRERGWSAGIVAVIGNRPEAPGLAIARREGIPVEVLDHRSFASREAFDGELAARIDAHRPDWVILAGFMRVLTDGFVAHFRDRLINIHPSLLPAFPGLATHRAALASGVCVHGATVHLVNETVDGGRILAQAVVPVKGDDDEARLAARVLAAEHRLLPHVVGWLVDEQLTIREGRLDWRGGRAPLQTLGCLP